MIGIIGVGQIGGALLSGFIHDSSLKETFSIYDVNQDQLSKYKAFNGVQIESHLTDVVKHSEIIFLCVKPYQFDQLASDIKEQLKEHQMLVSVAPNFSLTSLIKMFDHSKFIRMMPSTAMKVQRGVIALSKSAGVEQKDLAKLNLLMQGMGYLYWTKEEGINQTIGVAGSGIAFAYEMIEAMGQGGIYNGLNSKEAYKMAAETLVGAGEMLLKMDEHPAALRDQVCSPGGLTIKGISVLEEYGFKRSVIEAVKATYQKEE